MTNGTLTVQAVADLVGGRLCGPDKVTISRVRSLEKADADSLSACVDAHWLVAMATSRAAAILVPQELAKAPGPPTRIVVADPRRALALVTAALHPGPARHHGVAPTAIIGTGTTLGADVSIGQLAVIGSGCTIGDRCTIGPGVIIESGAVLGVEVRLEPRVVVYHDVILGDRVYCQAGAVIGSPGFGFLSSEAGHERVPQVGGCVIGDDVEIGAGSCIDRGSIDDTTIGRGTKIDNLVHVGHNVQIGEHCVLLAAVGVSGSTRIGNRVTLAGQAGLVGHIEIGDGARIGAQAGVISSVPAHGAVSGYPARPHREFLRAQAALYRLAPHVSQLERLARDEERHDDA